MVTPKVSTPLPKSIYLLVRVDEEGAAQIAPELGVGEDRRGLQEGLHLCGVRLCWREAAVV